MSLSVSLGFGVQLYQGVLCPDVMFILQKESTSNRRSTYYPHMEQTQMCSVPRRFGFSLQSSIALEVMHIFRRGPLELPRTQASSHQNVPMHSYTGSIFNGTKCGSNATRSYMVTIEPPEPSNNRERMHTDYNQFIRIDIQWNPAYKICYSTPLKNTNNTGVTTPSIIGYQFMKPHLSKASSKFQNGQYRVYDPSNHTSQYDDKRANCTMAAQPRTTQFNISHQATPDDPAQFYHISQQDAHPRRQTRHTTTTTYPKAMKYQRLLRNCEVTWRTVRISVPTRRWSEQSYSTLKRCLIYIYIFCPERGHRDTDDSKVLCPVYM